ncbi:nuclear nucleic acid-binding protein C1D-like [Glandiceps talaboti]
MAAAEDKDDFPSEIRDAFVAFRSSLTGVDDIFKPLLDTSLSEIQEKVTDPLDKAKLDLVAAYAINSMFWMYLTTQGINPKDHPIKQELDRIRNYMNRVKQIVDKKKAVRLDKGAASRFIKHALSDVSKDEVDTEKSPSTTTSKRKHEDKSASKKKKKKKKN